MKKLTSHNKINGWSVISKWLIKGGKRQIDLARLLNVTPSAISQVKSGIIMLNATQISLILDYLQISQQDACRMYTLIFNARLNKEDDNGYKRKLFINVTKSNNKQKITIDSNSSNVPLITFKQAVSYEPALESIESFVDSCSDKTALFPGAQVGNFALLVDQENVTLEFAPTTILLVAGDEYPTQGDMVIAKLRTGELISKYYSRKNNIIHLESKNPDAEKIVWRYQEDPGYVQWIHPVIEARLQLRAQALSGKINTEN